MAKHVDEDLRRATIAVLADTVMNAITWTYAHLRGRHHWSRTRARDQARALALRGVAADG